MQINSPTQVHGPQGLQGPHRNSGTARSQGATASPSVGDQLDISPAAEAAVQAAESGQFRADLVARVRSEIAAGSYETPEKFDAALDKLLNEIG